MSVYRVEEGIRRFQLSKSQLSQMEGVQLKVYDAFKNNYGIGQKGILERGLSGVASSVLNIFFRTTSVSIAADFIISAVKSGNDGRRDVIWGGAKLLRYLIDNYRDNYQQVEYEMAYLDFMMTNGSRLTQIYGNNNATKDEEFEDQYRVTAVLTKNGWLPM